MSIGRRWRSEPPGAFSSLFPSSRWSSLSACLSSAPPSALAAASLFEVLLPPVVSLIAGISAILAAMAIRLRLGLGAPLEQLPELDAGGDDKTVVAPDRAPLLSDAAIAEARRQVRGPAIGLLVTGILNWVMCLPIALFLSLNMGASRDGPGGLVFLVPTLLIVLSVLLLVAANTMKRLQAYGLAVAASFLAIIISPGNLIGLPIGIWALVVLSQREVRTAFAQRRVRAGGTPAAGGDEVHSTHATRRRRDCRKRPWQGPFGPGRSSLSSSSHFA